MINTLNYQRFEQIAANNFISVISAIYAITVTASV
jgi:hypothetical protein